MKAPFLRKSLSFICHFRCYKIGSRFFLIEFIWMHSVSIGSHLECVFSSFTFTNYWFFSQAKQMRWSCSCWPNGTLTHIGKLFLWRKIEEISTRWNEECSSFCFSMYTGNGKEILTGKLWKSTKENKYSSSTVGPVQAIELSTINRNT